MTNATSADAADRVAAELAGWPESVQQLLQAKDRQIEALCARLEVLTAQVEWFKRQIFGSKSERHVAVAESGQMHLGEMMPAAEPVAVPTQQVPAHRRAKPRRDFTDDAQGAPFFDTKQVPVITIEVPNEEAAALAPNQYEVVGHKVSHRLAQRPGSYVVLEYRRAVIKRCDTATLHCPPAPAGVLEGSRADVSFIAGVMVDKFCWHRVLRTRSPP
jgi:transposase